MVGSIQTSAQAVVESIKHFWHDEEAATAVEYALMASLIAVVIIAAVTTLGTSVRSTFVRVNAGIAH